MSDSRVGGTEGLPSQGSPEWRGDVPGAQYWELALPHVALTYFKLEPNVAFPFHAHEAEQITLVLEGQLRFELEGRTRTLGPGEAIAIPSSVGHAVTAGSEPVLAVDAWSPPPEHLGAMGPSAGPSDPTTC